MRRGDRSRFGDFCLTKEKAGTRDRAGIEVYVRGLGKLGFGKVGRSPLCPCHMVGVWNRGTPIPALPLFYRIPSSGMCTAGGRLCHTAHPASRAPLILFPFIFIFFWLCPQPAAPSGGALISAAYVEHCPPPVPTPPKLGWGCRHQPPPILVAPWDRWGRSWMCQFPTGLVWGSLERVYGGGAGDPESCFGEAMWGKKAGILSGESSGAGGFCAKTCFFPTTAHLNLHPFPLPSSRDIKQGLGPPKLDWEPLGELGFHSNRFVPPHQLLATCERAQPGVLAQRVRRSKPRYQAGGCPPSSSTLHPLPPPGLALRPMPGGGTGADREQD